MSSTTETMDLTQQFIQLITKLISPKFDNYWKSKHNQTELPEGLIRLRELTLPSEIMKQLVKNASSSKREQCFNELYDLIIRANQEGLSQTIVDDLTKLNASINNKRKNAERRAPQHRKSLFSERKESFEDIMKNNDYLTKKEALTAAEKGGDKTIHAKANYELGIFLIINNIKDHGTAEAYQYLKKSVTLLADKIAEARANYEIAVFLIKINKSNHAKEAYDFLKSAIRLKPNDEITAYAVREVTLIFDLISPKDHFHKDRIKYLQNAYAHLEKVKEFKEAKHIEERIKTLLLYGEELINSEDEQSIVVIKKALELKKDNEDAIKLLLQAYKKKKQDNELKHILDVVDDTSVSIVDTYLMKTGSSLCLEIASHGSAQLLEDYYHRINQTARDSEGNNALHLAAKAGRVELIPILRRCLEFKSINASGLTPVMVAAKHGQVETVLYILKLNIASTTTDKTDLLSVIISTEQSVVFGAVSKCKYHRELLEKIGQLYYKSPVATENFEDRSIFITTAVGRLYQTAITAKSKKMLALLIQHLPEGLNILHEDISPLHYAIQENFTEGAFLLIDVNRNLTLDDYEKEIDLAIKFATRIKHLTLVPYLNNKLDNIRQQKQALSNNKQQFIDQVSKKVFDDLKNKVDFDVNQTKRLRTQLSLALIKHDFLFSEDNLETTKNLLFPFIVKVLLEKIQIKDKITKTKGGRLKFVEDKLLKELLEIIDSRWAVQEPMLEVIESKITHEQRTISPIREFCDGFETQFDIAYGYFRDVSIGDLVPAQDEAAKEKMEIVKQTAAGVATISKTVAAVAYSAVGIMALKHYLQTRSRKDQAERMVALFHVFTPSERTQVIKQMAEQLAYKYQNQIYHLYPGSEGIEKFAECAVARIVEYITNDDKNQQTSGPSILSGALRNIKSWIFSKEYPPEVIRKKGVFNIFLDGIVRVSSKFPKEREQLKTINTTAEETAWYSNGIFENTGIITETEERYAHTNTPIEVYGYCRGTKSEADLRGLLNINSKTKELWGLGRTWEPVGAVATTPKENSPRKSILVAFDAERGRTADGNEDKKEDKGEHKRNTSKAQDSQS